MANELADQILGHMDDTSARYAIALEGDWGSGKTRFCEGELKEALAVVSKYAVVRVSLHGISGAASLHAMIATAVIKPARFIERHASPWFTTGATG